MSNGCQKVRKWQKERNRELESMKKQGWIQLELFPSLQFQPSTARREVCGASGGTLSDIGYIVKCR